MIWAAGVRATPLPATLGVPLDRAGRVLVEPDLSIPGHPRAFVIGDVCAFLHQEGVQGRPLPGVAPVAMQQGRFVARAIQDDLEGRPRGRFQYHDKGNLATIGRSAAVADLGRIRLSGFVAWMAWLVVHIYYLTGFKNRLLVVLQWAWSYVSFRRGARLIVNKEWRLHPPRDAISHGEPAQASGADARGLV